MFNQYCGVGTLVDSCGVAMPGEKFLMRKIKQLGKKLDFELINASDPAEVFSAMVKYRGKHGALTQ